MPPKPQTLRIQRTVQVSPVEAYRAFVHATALRDWLCNAAQTDPRPGGRIYLWWNSGYVATGEYGALEPGRKLSFTWHGKNEPAPTRVQVTFKAQGEAGPTRVTLAHTGLGAGKKWAAAAAEFARGWDLALENLQSLLETGVDLRIARLPRLGILIDDFNPEIAALLGVPLKLGIRLAGTVEGTGARAAGLQKDDVMVRLGGKRAVDFPSLSRALQGRHAGDRVPVVFYRGAEKHTVTMELSQRPQPQIPTPADLVETMRRSYFELNAELAQMAAGASEAEAAQRPAPDSWSFKESLAHLVAAERDFQSWAADMLNDNTIEDSLEFRTNVNERLAAMVARFDTVPALLAELKCAEDETLALLGALPPAFVARKHYYGRLAFWMEQVVPSHFREEHFGLMRAALAAAHG